MDGKSCKLPILFCAIIFAIAASTGPASAATITIDNSSSIADALLNVGADGTVILEPGIYFISSQIDITNSSTIRASDGHGQGDTIIDAQSACRIFSDTGGHSLTIEDLTLRNGAVTGNHGGAIICWHGDVTLTDTTITDCSTDGRGKCGGAIYCDTGEITLTGTTFTGCSANGGGMGGAIYHARGNITATSATFTDCTATNGNAGGIYCDYGSTSITMTNTTFTRCSGASMGGAIYTAANMTATSVTFTDCSAGVGGGAIHFQPGTNSSIHFSRIYDNTAGRGSALYAVGNVNATNNWWGSNDDPSSNIYGTVTYSPWLVLGGVADPSTINLTGTSVIRANMTYDVNGNDTSGSGYLPDGILMTFAVTSGNGSVSPSSGTTTNGAASTTFTPSATGNATVNVTVDNEILSFPLVVPPDPPVAGFSAGPLTGTPPLNVTFNDTSTGTITAWNWSFGDGEWFNTTDSALKNATHTYSSTGTYTVNLTVSNSAGSNTSSKADYITVSTSPTPTTTPTPAPAPVRSSSGGGGSNTNTGTGFATSIKTGENVSLGMDKGAVYLVSFTADKNIQKLIITVKRTVSVPSSIGAPDTEVYEYEDVTLYYTENSDLSNKTFEFKVKKSWLTENGYTYGDIVMLHYNEEAGEWEELTTTFTDEDGTYCYYSAKTPSFSWFAIAVSGDATIVQESTAAPVTKAVTAVSTHSSSSVATPSSTVSAVSSGDTGSSGGAGSWTSLLMPVLVVILVIIVAAVIVVRKKKEKYPDWWNKEFK
jgi:PGF-pre-PGF domain-containing protein